MGIYLNNYEYYNNTSEKALNYEQGNNLYRIERQFPIEYKKS